MTHTDEKVKWITRTALCTALVLLAQIVGRMLPAGAVIAGPFSINQLVTGSLVNLVLILAAASVGLWSGVACGVVSSILAALLGMTPVPFIVPAIALGNAVIAAAAWFFLGKSHGTGRRAAGVLVGARCEMRGAVADGSGDPGDAPQCAAQAGADAVGDVFLAAVCDRAGRRRAGARGLSGVKPGGGRPRGINIRRFSAANPHAMHKNKFLCISFHEIPL